MKICRFRTTANGPVAAGILLPDQTILNLTEAGITRLQTILEETNPLSELSRLASQRLPKIPVAAAQLLPPVDQQEVWAAGVTYLRSKQARMEESDFSATAYDRVYEAARPEIFFKSLPDKVVGPNDAVGIRRDATWSVPEPELALVLNSRGQIAGLTVGNDMSSRDIEGENLLYLPQAKVYDRSCALGPCIIVGASENDARSWTVRIEIVRQGKTAFAGQTSISQIKRSFSELADYLCRSQTFPNGAILLTGTGVVPPDAFTLNAGDTVRIEISGIGLLENPVEVV